MFTIEKTTREDYKTEREITRYRPILSGDHEPMFSGSISFAFWEVWSDEPQEKHDAAIAKVKSNVREVLTILAKHEELI